MSGSEREALKRLARQPSTPPAIAERARIVLACADGQTNTAVADRLGGIRWNGSSPGEPSAANVLTSTFAPSEATVVRPAGGCSSVGPFWSAASVAVYAGAHVAVEDHPVLLGATLVASVDGVAANQAATRIHRRP